MTAGYEALYMAEGRACEAHSNQKTVRRKVKRPPPTIMNIVEMISGQMRFEIAHPIAEFDDQN